VTGAPEAEGLEAAVPGPEALALEALEAGAPEAKAPEAAVRGAQVLAAEAREALGAAVPGV
jgi:hypothetical protein